MHKILLFIWGILQIVLIAALIVVPIRYFIFQPFMVQGQSMEPNFRDGDYLIIDEISYRFSEPHRGDIIVFRYPPQPSQRFIKRIVGLPGEIITIKDGKVFIGQGADVQVLDETDYLSHSIDTTGNLQIVLDKDQYFVLGDNRSGSYDSRRFGALGSDYIIGRVLLRLWPITALAKIEAPAY